MTWLPPDKETNPYYYYVNVRWSEQRKEWKTGRNKRKNEIISEKKIMKKIMQALLEKRNINLKENAQPASDGIS